MEGMLRVSIGSGRTDTIAFSSCWISSPSFDICVCGRVCVRMDHRETDYGGQRSTLKHRN